MVEVIRTIAVSGLFLACVLTACYIVFFPLARTIAGGVQILKLYVLKRSVASLDVRAFGAAIPDPELGLTMADGGEKHQDEKGMTGR